MYQFQSEKAITEKILTQKIICIDSKHIENSLIIRYFEKFIPLSVKSMNGLCIPGCPLSIDVQTADQRYVHYLQIKARKSCVNAKRHTIRWVASARYLLTGGGGVSVSSSDGGGGVYPYPVLMGGGGCTRIQF